MSEAVIRKSRGKSMGVTGSNESGKAVGARFLTRFSENESR